MYVRMSTDHQKYSTQNQRKAIHKYAAQRNMEIVATYSDDGKSGLTLAGRPALNRLLEDVTQRRADFSIILVLDVTRWGRFQNPDEGAYHEFTCQRAGVAIHFVAEQFENDGSSISSMVKGLKRTMAAEYSRELSAKVFIGQCRLIEMGYRQGGPPGFGLRRMLVDENGTEKGLLKRGEHKSLQTDRVVLVPGPTLEQEIVRWIYKKFVSDGLREADIADTLNQRGTKTDLGRDWNHGTIHQVLTNEKYIGNNVFNRTSHKLKIRRTVNAVEDWVRADSAFEPIVTPQDFYAAKGIVLERNRRFSDNEMLDKLKILHQQKGWLSGFTIDEHDGMPSSSAYSHRFGSLLRAYKLIGYTPDRDYRYIEINRRLRELHTETVRDTILKIQNLGTHVNFDDGNGLLQIHDELSVSIVICRCVLTGTGAHRWNVRFDTGLHPDLTIVVRMDADNLLPIDYYLLPAFEIEKNKIRLSENNGLELEAFRSDTLDPFLRLTERTNIRELL